MSRSGVARFAAATAVLEADESCGIGDAVAEVISEETSPPFCEMNNPMQIPTAINAAALAVLFFQVIVSLVCLMLG